MAKSKIIKSRRKRFGRQLLKVEDLKLRTVSNEVHGFGIIDRRYSRQVELLPGLVSYSRPLTGTIELIWHFNDVYVRDILRRAFRRWVERVGYHEIRSGKTSLGLRATDDLTVFVEEASDYLTERIFIILYKIIKVESFPIFLEKLGLYNMEIPNFLMDAMHIIASSKNVQRISTTDQSMIKVNIELSDYSKELYEKYAVKEGEKRKTKRYEIPFEVALFELCSFCTQSNFTSTTMITNFSIFQSASPHLLNAAISRDENGEKIILAGYTATEKDIALVLYIGIWFKGTDLPENAIDSFFYVIDNNMSRGPMTNYFCNEYLSIEDKYVSPQINTPLEEKFEEDKETPKTQV